MEYPEEIATIPNQPYAVHNLNQVTQPILYNLYPDQFCPHYEPPPSEPEIVHTLHPNIFSNDTITECILQFTPDQQTFLKKF